LKRILALLTIFIAFACILPDSVKGQCAGSPLVLPMNQNNGQDGLMFNLTALTDVTVDSVWGNFAAGTIGVAEIWSCPTGIVGNQANAGAWTLAGSANNVVSAGINNSTQIPVYINVPVLNGTTTGFYVTSTGASGPIMRYTNGVGTAGNFYMGNGIFLFLKATERTILLARHSIRDNLMGTFFTVVVPHLLLLRGQ